MIGTISGPVDPIRLGTAEADNWRRDARTRRMGEQAATPRHLLGHFVHIVLQQRHALVVLLQGRQPPGSQGNPTTLFFLLCLSQHQ